MHSLVRLIYIDKLIAMQNVRNIIMFLVLLLASYDRVLAQSGDNLLENNSFEEIVFMEDNIFKGWSCHNNSNVVRSNDFAYDGKYSAKMSSKETGNTAIVNQVVEVIPNSVIRIRHHYYIKQWKDKGARMYCYFRERHAESSTLSNDYLKEFYDAKTMRIIRGGGYNLTYFPHTLNQWLLFDETITVPPDANYFVFEIHSFYGTTLYVDDCFVGRETVSYINDIIPEEVSKSYFSIGGQKLESEPHSGIYIVRTTDLNGNITSRKYFKK